MGCDSDETVRPFRKEADYHAAVGEGLDKDGNKVGGLSASTQWDLLIGKMGRTFHMLPSQVEKHATSYDIHVVKLLSYHEELEAKKQEKKHARN